MGKYKPYPACKDSGVEWLGDVPSHWKRTRVKDSCLIIGGYPFDSKKFSKDIGLPLVRIRDIHRSETEVRYCGSAEGCPRIQRGDVLVGMDGDFNVTMWKGGEALLNQRVACVCCDDDIEKKFVWYLLSEPLKIINDLTYFTTVKHLSTEDIRRIKYYTPPMKEKIGILSFLDDETAKIDRLIEKQEKLIERLKEKRQAVIFHAVTKGLSSDVRMKESGVEWLGEIPAHWEVKRFKHLVVDIKAGPFGSSLTKSMYVSSGYKVYGQQHVINQDLTLGDYYISEQLFERMEQYHVESDDILITCMGTIGKATIVPKEHDAGIINPRLVRVSLQKDIFPDYFVEVFNSSYVYAQIAMHSRGGTMDGLNISIISNLLLPTPPYDEQIIMFQRIKERLAAINSLCLAAEKQNDLLKERRKALISAAVTGKIDVREWKAGNN